MSLVIRMDIDRPYGRVPLSRHVLSRVSSDYWFPKLNSLGYLDELKQILAILSAYKAHAYAFFRRCTLPTAEVLALLAGGNHRAGLHLEDSRSFDSFITEKSDLEAHLGSSVTSFSKHGSGGKKFGRRHHAPYEPEKYIQWGGQAGMTHFFGNLENPEMEAVVTGDGLVYYPSAFWLETPWRDTAKYPVEWLLNSAEKRDIVVLIHPENVLASRDLTRDFETLLKRIETKIF